MNKDRFNFRGLTKNNEWCYGSLLYYAGDAQIWEQDGKNYIVNSETVGQCSGLKDKNGNLIYDGDIVKFQKIYKCACFTQEEEVLFKVIWEGYGFYLSQIKIIKGNVSYINGRRLTEIFKKDTYTEHQTDISLEVIGNIYENKDLLERIY